MNSLVEVKGLTKHFASSGGHIVRAVDGVDLAIEKGETLGLVGESGCGKSTIGKLILRLIEPTDGKIRFDGCDLSSLGKNDMRRMRRRMQIVFQDPYSSLDPRMKIGNIIAEPLEVHGIGDKKQRQERVAELLRVVGLDADCMQRYPHMFSGGQRQRIGIARAIALNPDFIVADEPVSALDVSIQAQIVNLLQDLQEQFGLTYLFISHGLAVVRHISTRVGVMYLGKLVELAPASEIYDKPLHPYTQALLAAAPVPDPQIKINTSGKLKGDISDPLNPPPGCRFNTRCPYAFDRCKTEEPKLTEIAPKHWSACHLNS